LNWGAAETAAYGCLVQEGYSIRAVGQDVQRGTFSHRHAVLVSGKDGAKWNVLNSLAAKNGGCVFYNSALSENAAMGFEYGYALAKPEKSLVIWEGQFGDFANGAQVVIDQFVSSAEAKRGQHNHLALLLPHGYEGQGPEHSSARLERYLQLCAEDNMRVCYPSTPAQVFHLLRRQAKSSVKKPLVVMTPKSLLRNPAAVSPLSDLLHGGWQPVIGDSVDAKGVKKVLLCSGKVYYDLLARRDADKRNDIAIVRVEELYPWPADALAKILGGLKTKDVYWVQEEPRNMGAWAHVREYWNDAWGYLHFVGRPASASPAVGTTVRHNAEQKAIVDEVFGAAKAQAAA
jgi:2-oxoglutarate dehydrogenase E1 component